MKKITILVLCCLTLGVAKAQDDRGFEIAKNLEIFSAVYKNLNLNYVDDVDPGKAIKVAIDAMLSSMDPYTNYFPESQMEDVKLQLLGQYGGVGALIVQRGDSIYISEPYKGLPAAEAGLKAAYKSSNAIASLSSVPKFIAMIPGTSRSFATIAGGMQQGLPRKTAAEFSFFLAVPTMAAATGYELLKMLLKPEYRQVLADNIGILLLGCVVAFIVAVLAIKFFISFLTKYGFKAFGWYRIAVGGLILVLLLTGHTLQMVD